MYHTLCILCTNRGIRPALKRRSGFDRRTARDLLNEISPISIPGGSIRADNSIAVNVAMVILSRI